MTKLRGAGLSFLLLAVLLTGCGGSDDSSNSSNTTETTASSTNDTDTTEATEGTSAPAPQKVVLIRYAGGKVLEPTSRVNVKLNENVQIRVESDIAEEIHFHGYDISTDVAPGVPAVIDFTANIPGVFEIEFEKSSKQLASIGVNG